MSRNSCTCQASISAMRPSESGGTDLGRCSGPRSATGGPATAGMFDLAVAPRRVFAKINRKIARSRRTVDHEGAALESYVTKRRGRKAALKFLRKSMKRLGSPEVIVADKPRSYGAAMKVTGNADRQETRRQLNNWVEYSHLPFRRRDVPCCASGKCAMALSEWCQLAS